MNLIVVQICGHDLETTANMPLVDRMARELFLLGVPFVVVQAWHFGSTRVAPIVAEVTFTGDQIGCSITVDVGNTAFVCEKYY